MPLPEKVHFIQRSGLLILSIQESAQQKDFDSIPELLAEQLGYPGTPALSAVVINCSSAARWTQLSHLISRIPGKNRLFLVGPADIPLGGGSSIQWAKSLEDVFSKLAQERFNKLAQKTVSSSVDPAFQKAVIKTFQEAAIRTLEIQCSTKFKAGEPYPKTAQNKVTHDIAASIGMMSRTLNGTVAIGFPQETFLKVMGKMLGEEHSSLSEDVQDGCGEILNIIFGQAKKSLNDAGYQFGKTIPTIFMGESLKVRQLTPNPTFIIPFHSDLGPMVIELGYRRN